MVNGEFCFMDQMHLALVFVTYIFSSPILVLLCVIEIIHNNSDMFPLYRSIQGLTTHFLYYPCNVSTFESFRPPNPLHINLDY